MRTFILRRAEDASGVSGTGDVAEGVQLHDGKCVLSWFGALHTTAIYDDIDSVVRIHGHEGKTQVIWDEERDLRMLIESLLAALQSFRS